jgi:hypothetical protein
LKQGNGRGTCCWSTNILIFKKQKIRCGALSGCLDTKKFTVVEADIY